MADIYPHRLKLHPPQADVPFLAARRVLKRANEVRLTEIPSSRHFSNGVQNQSRSDTTSGGAVING
jgi:hypothetical protein